MKKVNRWLTVAGILLIVSWCFGINFFNFFLLISGISCLKARHYSKDGTGCIVFSSIALTCSVLLLGMIVFSVIVLFPDAKINDFLTSWVPLWSIGIITSILGIIAGFKKKQFFVLGRRGASKSFRYQSPAGDRVSQKSFWNPDDSESPVYNYSTDRAAEYWSQIEEGRVYYEEQERERKAAQEDYNLSYGLATEASYGHNEYTGYTDYNSPSNYYDTSYTNYNSYASDAYSDSYNYTSTDYSYTDSYGYQ